MAKIEAKRLADIKAKQEAAARAKREAQDCAERERVARLEAEASAKRDAEEKARRDAEALAKNEAEQRAKREAEDRTERERVARIDAEARAKREAEEKACRDAEARAKNEVEQRNKRVAQDRAEHERVARIESTLKAFWSGFEKIGRNGEVLPMIASQWAAVKHLETGLIWATNWGLNDDFPVRGGLRYSDACYDYYQDGQNTASHIQRVNQRLLCGKKDWYLPNKEELESLTQALYLSGDYCLDYYKAIFPNDGNGFFWSASTSTLNDGKSWRVNFYRGHSYNDSKDFGGFVRAVRAG